MAESVKKSDRKMPTVLLVDDESDLREIYTFKLQREGYDVVQAEGGKQA